MERTDALRILGIAESASDAEINAAYQGKVRAIQSAFARSKRSVGKSEDGNDSVNALALTFNTILQQLNNVYLILEADTSAVLDVSHVSNVENESSDDKVEEELVIPIIATPSSSKKFLAPAAVLVAVAGLGGLYTTGHLDSLINGFSDLDPELVLAQREQAKVLIGEITVLKSQLSAVITSVQLDAEAESAGLDKTAEEEQDAHPSEESGPESLSALSVLWAEYVQTQIVDNESYHILPETFVATKQSMLDDHNVAAAVVELESIKQAYVGFSQCLDQLEMFSMQQLAVQMARIEWDKNKGSNVPISKAEELIAQQQKNLDEKTACQNMHLTPQILAYFHDATQQTLPLLALMEQVQKQKAQWARYKKRYSLKNPAQISQAEKMIKQGQEHYLAGLLVESTQSYNSVLDLYSEARGAVADQVAEAKRKASGAKKVEKTVEVEKGPSDEVLAAMKAAELKRINKRKAVETYTGKLVNIPGGTFTMGDSSGAGDPDELPIHKVAVKKFTMIEHEVTFDQWDRCHKAGRCIKPADEGWGRGKRPVIQISWKEIDGYLEWVNEQTGKDFRLATEAEWEYAAKAGKNTKYTWGNSINCKQARFDYYSDRCVKTNATDPVKTYKPNAFGLYDIHGNVWEMTSDCWHHNYKGAPNDGSRWETGDCTRRVLRGGSWKNTPFEIMSANRNWSAIDYRLNTYGFRLAHDDWFDFVDSPK